MHLVITLPSDRRYAGYFTLVDNSGQLLMDGRARGKSDNSKAIEHDNPTRNSTQSYGDTPTGEYEEAFITHFNPPHKRLGKAWIAIEGKSGDALIARNNGRWGIGIHAGRLHTDGTLITTYGCVRLSDRDMDQMCAVIKDDPISITIREED